MRQSRAGGLPTGTNPFASTPETQRPHDGPRRIISRRLKLLLSIGAQGGTSTSFLKGGYRFVYTPEAKPFGFIAGYTITARPLKFRKGLRSFFANESAVIRVTSEDRDARVSDPAI